MHRYGGSLAFEAAMHESPYSQYDSGEDGMFEECRSCSFHPPHGTDRTCVFHRCPYSPTKESTHRSKPKKQWNCAYVKQKEEVRDDDLDIDSIYETLKANFLYDSTVTDYNRDELDNILDIMVEMVCRQSRTLTISKVGQPIELVRKRVYQINYMTMQYILNSLEKTSTEPQDPKAYIMTVIFNAPVTKAVRDAPRIRNMLG